jgi:hypothetical protein
VRDGAGEKYTNVPHHVMHHADGFEWGYGGSGPSDFALNILHEALRLLRFKGGKTKCFREECFALAWSLHHEFKSRYVAALDQEGGVIPFDMILSYLETKIAWPDTPRFVVKVAEYACEEADVEGFPKITYKHLPTAVLVTNEQRNIKDGDIITNDGHTFYKAIFRTLDGDGTPVLVISSSELVLPHTKYRHAYIAWGLANFETNGDR